MPDPALATDGEKLRFVAARYDAYFFSWTNIALGFGGLVILALAPLDYLVAPEQFPTFLRLRMLTALAFLPLWLLIRRVSGHLPRIALAGAAGVAVSTMIALMIARLDGHQSVYFAGFILVFIYTSCFLPLPPAASAALATLIYAIYLLPILAYDTIANPRFFLGANILMIACATSMLLLQYFNYRRLLQGFGVQFELERQQQRLESLVQERTSQLSRNVEALESMVVEREDAAAQLHKTNDSLQALIHASPLAIEALDAEGRVTLWNPAAERLFGWSATEVVGRFNPIVPAHRREEFAENFAGIMGGASIAGREIVRQRKDGTALTLSLSAAPMHAPTGEISGVMAVLMDVTEHRKLEVAIRQAKEEWEDSFDTINDAITIHDRDFNILRANRAAAELLGIPMPTLTRQKCHQSYHGAACPPEDCPSCRTLRTGEATVTEIFEPHLGKHLEIKALPRRDREGLVVGLIHVVRDLTEASRLKNQLFQAQKMEAVGQLAGGIAHDFNNILSAITCFSDLLHLKMAAPDPLRTYVEQIQAAAERAANLTRSLLAFSRKQIFSLKPADLNGIVRGVHKLLARLVREDIELRTELCGPDLVVLADAGQIEQVLMNLVTNARDAMPGGGTLTIATAPFEMDQEFVSRHRYGKPGSFALLTVSDTGAGMDEKTLGRIFEPFFTTKELGKGTGLGLAMMYGIVKQHNGFIEVDSEPGRGTRFMTWLPLAPLAASVPSSGQAPPPLPRGVETVLVAEDEPTLRQIVREVLESHGYRVLLAEDGEAAVRLFDQNAAAVDLALLDLVMPKCGGVAALQQMRRKRPGLRVLFMSGYSEEAAANPQLLGGDAEFIKKPIAVGDLLRTVRRTLDAPGGQPGRTAG